MLKRLEKERGERGCGTGYTRTISLLKRLENIARYLEVVLNVRRRICACFAYVACLFSVGRTTLYSESKPFKAMASFLTWPSVSWFESKLYVLLCTTLVGYGKHVDLLDVSTKYFLLVLSV